MPIQSSLPPTGNIAATDRKESAYDTEVVAGQGGNLPSQAITLFQSYQSFQNTTGNNSLEQKQKGRDTNLTGGGGGLPQGYQLLWYEWRGSIRTLGANLNTSSTSGVSEQMERIRENGSIKAVFSQSPLITANLRDLVSFVDARSVFTTFPSTTTMSPCIAQRGGKVVAISGGPSGDEPFTIVGLEQLEMQLNWPGATAVPAGQGGPLVAIVPYYAMVLLDGIMSRASL